MFAILLAKEFSLLDYTRSNLVPKMVVNAINENHACIVYYVAFFRIFILIKSFCIHDFLSCVNKDNSVFSSGANTQKCSN